jgi:hypothetical protein
MPGFGREAPDESPDIRHSVPNLENHWRRSLVEPLLPVTSVCFRMPYPKMKARLMQD